MMDTGIRAEAGRDRRVGIYSGADLVGDGLQKLAMLRAVRAAFPDHEVVYVTSGPTALATTLRPLTVGLVDRFLSDTGILRSWKEFLRGPPLREYFSVFIDTQPVVWRSLLLRRVPHGLFVTNAAKYRLSDRKPADGRRKKPLNLVERLLDLVELASGRPPRLDHRIAVPDETMARAAQVLPAVEGRTLVGLAPGAGGRQKCWPLYGYLELARGLAADGLTPVFLLGQAEEGWRSGILETVPEALFPLQDHQTLGGYDPVTTVAVARRLTAAVANDSGTNAMLAAADVPLVTLFGPSNPDKFRPLVTHGAIVRSTDFGGQGTDLIPVSAVRAALDDVLRRADLRDEERLHD